MCRLAACESHDQLSQAAVQSRRRSELENTVQSLETSISGQSGGMDFNTFLQEVESETLEIDSIPPRIDQPHSESLTGKPHIKNPSVDPPSQPHQAPHYQLNSEPDQALTADETESNQDSFGTGIFPDR